MFTLACVCVSKGQIFNVFTRYTYVIRLGMTGTNKHKVDTHLQTNKHTWWSKTLN